MAKQSKLNNRRGKPADAHRPQPTKRVKSTAQTDRRSAPTDDEHADEFVFGRHAVAEALREEGASTINKLFVQSGLTSEPVEAILASAKKKKILVSSVPKTKLDLLSDGGNHQGVLVAMAPYAYATIDDLFANAEAAGQDPFFLVLDNLEDPHNLGSILRTADAVGVHGIIIPKHRAVGLTGTVAKLSTGAIEHVPVARVTNLTSTIKLLKDRGMWVFGTAMDGQDFRQWDAHGAVALVIGNEGKGISPGVAKQMDATLTIPMVGHVQSLNASVAAGILMYQAFTSREAVK
ncbi:23S rRNA (guanosine(2251)-2'-O)-methyltransferase RlmB [Lacticaseibacillus nasuensis]|uniref:23S rRNA (guanosine(2251)-2'-O)-methyltransferase RlmB n=1 Tax=Lacticaseibacillus nasuensis TaxID=944671 RepID=UPI00224579FC|nr:23S rRNA (guanosine(2251)-2'-O)-methyltransferase RlmB [Lacticaseibacillus nasuensis]MCX2455251.1 23S rRNA (guanosine(2251)-2'-O)-methyltransferase RlmB [Lacticaseibacillus nasuensis]